MNLTVQIDPQSFASIKAAIVADFQQPDLKPIGLVSEDHGAVAKKIIDHYGDNLVNSIVDTHGNRIAEMMAKQITASDVSDHINLSDVASEISLRALAEYFDVADIADRFDNDDIADRVSQNIDTSAIAEKVAENFSMSDIVSEIDTSSIADNIDLSDLASNIGDMMDVQEVANCLNEKAIAREIVGQFISNEEFRKSFMDALLSSLTASRT